MIYYEPRQSDKLELKVLEIYFIIRFFFFSPRNKSVSSALCFLNASMFSKRSGW